LITCIISQRNFCNGSLPVQFTAWAITLFGQSVVTRDTDSVHVCCLQASNRMCRNLCTCPESFASLRCACTAAPMFLTPATAFPLLLPPHCTLHSESAALRDDHPLLWSDHVICRPQPWKAAAGMC
jgi:hypothetical protein